MIEANSPSGATLYAYDQGGHLLGEYDGSGNLIQETVWLGDIPVATIRPSASSVAIYYVETDHLNTPREVLRPSDNTLMWTWFSGPFGSNAPNTNPQAAGAFTYDLRFPGQIAGAWGSNYQNYMRDYDPQVGRYVEFDPIGLAGGSFSTYAYANGDSLDRVDPSGQLFGTPPATVLNPESAAVTLAWYAGYGIGTLIYDEYSTQIDDALDDILNPPVEQSNVIPFPQRPASNSGSNNCPPDDGCERDQKALLSRRLLLENLLRAGTVTVQDYVLKARTFNKDVATHNARCPNNPVRPFPIGPRGM